MCLFPFRILRSRKKTRTKQAAKVRKTFLLFPSYLYCLFCQNSSLLTAHSFQGEASAALSSGTIPSLAQLSTLCIMHHPRVCQAVGCQGALLTCTELTIHQHPQISFCRAASYWVSLPLGELTAPHLVFVVKLCSQFICSDH